MDANGMFGVENGVLVLEEGRVGEPVGHAGKQVVHGT